MRKYVILIFIAILTLSSLMIIKPATSQITKPSVPEFTLKYTNYSHYVPENYTYKIDPYTGQQVRVDHGDYTVQNRTIEVNIKSQPFTPYKDQETNRDYWLHYNISLKGHFEENWSYYSGYDYSASTNSDYTIFLFSLSERGSENDGMTHLGELSTGSQIDFRVAALIGYYTQVEYPPEQFGARYRYEFIGESSEWSQTQTIIIGNDATTPTTTTSPTSSATIFPSQNPISTPEQSGPQTVAFLGLDWPQVAIVTLLVIIAVLLVFVVVFLHKRNAISRLDK